MLRRVISGMSKRVNFLIDCGSRGKVLRISVSRWMFGVVAALLLVFSGAAIYSVASRARTEVDYERLSKLTRENRTLEMKYSQLQKQIDTLELTMGALGRHDIKLRVHSNMQVLPEDVRKLGVGGGKKEDPNLAQLREIRSNQYKTVEEVSEAVDALLRRANYQKESFTEIADTLQKKEYLRDHTPSIIPCNGWQHSGFGYRIDPFTKRPRKHNGIDISNAPATPIVAPANGTVSYTGARSGYGLCLTIDHGNGVETFYAHLSAIDAKPGQEVLRGEVIGRMGTTGRTTGTHLHYEVHVADIPVNPLNYIIDAEYVTD